VKILYEIKAPKENADEVFLIGKIYFKDKDKIHKNDTLMDLETSKTTIVIDSPTDGFVEYLVDEGNSVNVGEIVLRIHGEPDTILSKKGLEIEAKSGNEFVNKQIVSNKAKEYIDKHKIDISDIQKNFVSLNDLVDTESTDIIEAKGLSEKSFAKSILAPLEANLKVKKRTLSLAKQIEISALSDVQSTGLVSTIFYNIDNCNFPESENLIINSAGSFLPIIAFEVAKLLVKYPLLNAYYDNDYIMEYADINIGIALDIDDGLKVYTIRNSDKLDFKKLEYQISQGIYNYFHKSLTPDEIKGSTFTITDLSSLGIDRFVPLINYKQSAILGISAIDKKLNRLTLSLSFDHRVTEGKVASNFLSELSSLLSKYSDQNKEIDI